MPVDPSSPPNPWTSREPLLGGARVPSPAPPDPAPPLGIVPSLAAGARGALDLSVDTSRFRAGLATRATTWLSVRGYAERQWGGAGWTAGASAAFRW